MLTKVSTLRSLRSSSVRAFGTTASAPNGFILDEDLKSYQQMARKFAKEEMIPAAAEHDRTGAYPHDIFKKAWEIGFVFFSFISFSICDKNVCTITININIIMRILMQ